MVISVAQLLTEQTGSHCNATGHVWIQILQNLLSKQLFTDLLRKYQVDCLTTTYWPNRNQNSLRGAVDIHRTPHVPTNYHSGFQDFTTGLCSNYTISAIINTLIDKPQQIPIACQWPANTGRRETDEMLLLEARYTWAISSLQGPRVFVCVCQVVQVDMKRGRRQKKC